MNRETRGLHKPRGGNAPSRVATDTDLQDFWDDELERGYAEEAVRCGKCSGTGRYWGPGGVCFACNGKGMLIGRVYTPERRAELDAANEARIQKKRDKAAKERADAKLVSLQRYPDAHKISAELLDEIEASGEQAAMDKYGSFIVDVATKGEKYGFTQRQAESLVAAYNKGAEIRAKREAERDELNAAPDGRQTISGEVVYVTQKDTPYGLQWKMIVLDDRKFKVWSTVPAEIRREMNMPLESTLKGKRVMFDATLKVSDDDETFAFASRPSKASVEIPTASA